MCFFEPTWPFYLRFNLSKTIYFLKRTWFLEDTFCLGGGGGGVDRNKPLWFDRTESSQVLKITNKHYYRRVYKVAKEEYADSYEIVLIRWNIFKESWINEWNWWSIICQIRVLLNMNTTSGELRHVGFFLINLKQFVIFKSNWK